MIQLYNIVQNKIWTLIIRIYRGCGRGRLCIAVQKNMNPGGGYIYQCKHKCRIAKNRNSHYAHLIADSLDYYWFEKRVVCIRQHSRYAEQHKKRRNMLYTNKNMTSCRRNTSYLLASSKSHSGNISSGNFGAFERINKNLDISLCKIQIGSRINEAIGNNWRAVNSSMFSPHWIGVVVMK